MSVQVPSGSTPTPRGELPREAGVYVHFPYCVHRCHYCDFNTRAVASPPRERYARAVLAELDRRASALDGRRVVSVYFGGGTPGLWGARWVGAIVHAVERVGGVRASELEVTIEVNPGECDEALLRAYREEGGCNRVSFGVQSFDDAILRRLDRIHDARAAHAALDAAVRAGYERWSLDLMFALPGQTLEAWQETLEIALGHAPPHLSVYNLTVEQATPLAALVRRGRVRLPPDEQQLEMMQLAADVLADGGYAHYEISNYAKPGQASRHNLLYWTGRPYLGLGAGAHSWLPAHGQGLGVRQANVRSDRDYVEAALHGRDTAAFRERIDARTHLDERVLTGLRLPLEGVDLDDVQRVTGLDPAALYGERAAALHDAGLLDIEARHWRLTRAGLAVADAVIAHLLAHPGNPAALDTPG